jgi:adenine-specific DNA-methyltransferase
MRLIAEDPLRRGWTTPGLLWEIAVKEGFGLNSVIEEVTGGKAEVWKVTDPEKEPAQRFLACFAERIPAEIAKQLGLARADLFVVRDSALDDTLASNLALQCRLKTV